MSEVRIYRSELSMAEIADVLSSEGPGYFRKRFRLRKKSFSVTYKSLSAAIRVISPPLKMIRGKYYDESGTVKVKLKVVNGFSSFWQATFFVLATFGILMLVREKYNISTAIAAISTVFITLFVVPVTYFIAKFSQRGTDMEEQLLLYLETVLRLHQNTP